MVQNQYLRHASRAISGLKCRKNLFVANASATGTGEATNAHTTRVNAPLIGIQHSQSVKKSKTGRKGNPMRDELTAGRRISSRARSRLAAARCAIRIASDGGYGATGNESSTTTLKKKRINGRNNFLIVSEPARYLPKTLTRLPARTCR